MKECGKVIGYCPTCFIAVGSRELNAQCSRCKQLLLEDNILDEADVDTAKQSKKEYTQSHMSFVRGMDMGKPIAHGGNNATL